MTQEQPAEHTPEILSLLQAQHADVNSVLHHCDINIQQDALDRLRHDEIDYEDEYLTLSYAKKTRDQDLPFIITFFSEFFLVNISGFATFFQAYDYFKSPKQLVAQVELCVQALFERQIRALLSVNKGNIYGVEIILNTTPDSAPVVILSDAKFPMFKKQGDDVTILFNSLGEGPVTLPADFFLYSQLPAGTYPIMGRQLKSESFTPLTRAEMETATKQSMYQTTAIEPEEQAWQYVLWTWQFWLLFIVATVIGFAVVMDPWRGLYFPITGAVIFYFVLPRIIKDTADKRPLFYRMYKALPDWLRKTDQVAVFMAAFVATFFLTDSYLTGTTTPTSYFQVATQHAVLLIPVVAAVGLIGLSLAFEKKRLTILKLLVYLVSVVGYLVLQTRYIDQNVFPETFMANVSSTIGVCAVLLPFIVLIYRLYSGRRQHLQAKGEIS